ncbi:MAG: hypothetical protein ACUVRS_06265 [Armatimonadota bacterium]
MRKEKIILEDGRYLVYYWFGKRGGGGSEECERADGDVRAGDERSGEPDGGGGN